MWFATKWKFQRHAYILTYIQHTDMHTYSHTYILTDIHTHGHTYRLCVNAFPIEKAAKICLTSNNIAINFAAAQ